MKYPLLLLPLLLGITSLFATAGEAPPPPEPIIPPDLSVSLTEDEDPSPEAASVTARLTHDPSATDEAVLARLSDLLATHGAFPSPTPKNIEPPTDDHGLPSFRILSLERLSSGQVILVWKGDPDALYAVQSSDNLHDWGRMDSFIPLSNGIGIWSHHPTEPKNFYRVIEEQPHDPFFPGIGNDAPPVGTPITEIALDIVYIGSTPIRAEVRANYPGPIPSAIFYIDGEEIATIEALDGVHRFHIPIESLGPGTHTLHAVLDASHDTMPTPDEPFGGSLAKYHSGYRTFTHHRWRSALPAHRLPLHRNQYRPLRSIHHRRPLAHRHLLTRTRGLHQLVHRHPELRRHSRPYLRHSHRRPDRPTFLLGRH